MSVDQIFSRSLLATNVTQLFCNRSNADARWDGILALGRPLILHFSRVDKILTSMTSVFQCDWRLNKPGGAISNGSSLALDLVESIWLLNGEQRELRLFRVNRKLFTLETVTAEYDLLQISSIGDSDDPKLFLVEEIFSVAAGAVLPGSVGCEWVRLAADKFQSHLDTNVLRNPGGPPLSLRQCEDVLSLLSDSRWILPLLTALDWAGPQPPYLPDRFNFNFVAVGSESRSRRGYLSGLGEVKFSPTAADPNAVEIEDPIRLVIRQGRIQEISAYWSFDAQKRLKTVRIVSPRLAELMTNLADIPVSAAHPIFAVELVDSQSQISFHFCATLSLVTHLDVNNCRLEDLSGVNLQPFSRLESLSLEGNKIAQLPEEFVQNLAGLSTLRRLSISRNRLATLPDSLFRLVQLQQVEVNRNRLRVLPRLSARLILGHNPTANLRGFKRLYTAANMPSVADPIESPCSLKLLAASGVRTSNWAVPIGYRPIFLRIIDGCYSCDCCRRLLPTDRQRICHLKILLKGRRYREIPVNVTVCSENCRLQMPRRLGASICTM